MLAQPEEDQLVQTLAGGTAKSVILSEAKHPSYERRGYGSFAALRMTESGGDLRVPSIHRAGEVP